MCRRIRALLQVILASLMLTACGSSQTDILDDIGEAINNSTKEATQKDRQSDIDMTRGEISDFKTLGTETPNKDTASYEISDVAATVCYEGEDFIKSVFAAGADMLYIYGIKPEGSYFFGGMEEEKAQFQEFSIEMPDDMRISYMTVDRQASCHMLWMSVETTIVDGVTQNLRTFERARIIVVNKSGEVEKDIDVSTLFAEEQIRPNFYCFAVDDEGSYYLGNGRELVRLKPDGSLEARISCGGTIQAVGCGRSGEIYCIYAGENGKEVIGKLEQNSGAEVIVGKVGLPSVGAIYLHLTLGTDTELILYNKEGGVFTYDSETDTVQQRIAGEQLPVPGTSVSGYGFLGDGRLCLLTREKEKKV